MSEAGSAPSAKSTGLLQQLRRRFRAPSISLAPARADAPHRWRTSVGGFDPATPYAEALINYHNHAATFMIFVVITVIHCIRK
ncbi:cytochrome C family oxidase subunit transmembrane domain [Babesia ovis]|uniref:Cytochrome C family oxidase subunit transmembrane domain n=1 Tax=Babesia ovis TaxID=5869 RepID=A0A9W5TAC8_BABOV|nr:cytochrome C family oxidase subunit transmembrane domain [Babesia ovis]